jgi:catechol 2,3-dioxygenase-like lactoylglutathione lyase family enzyme
VTSPIESISAVTLATPDMGAATRFYDALGFVPRYGGPDAPFTSYRVGGGYLNLQLDPAWQPGPRVWGRVILWVDDVDAIHARAVAAGFAPAAPPADAPWGERYFHLGDPSGHEISFARPLDL